MFIYRRVRKRAINSKIYVEMNKSKFENVFEQNNKYKNRIFNIIFEKGAILKDLKIKYVYPLNLDISLNEEILEATIILYGLWPKILFIL